MTTPEPLRSLLDRVELEEVMNRYATSIDLRDWGRLRTVFVDDEIEADFTSMGIKQVFRGPVEEWVERVRQTIVGFDATQHFFANHSTEINGDSAVDTRYMQARHQLGDASNARWMSSRPSGCEPLTRAAQLTTQSHGTTARREAHVTRQHVGARAVPGHLPT